ncbi:hypothetical protein O3G_MSEX000856 [Manduca sexta]|nr:hypothetical protein O3G_MSEX000856 [Manduca sexta]
MTADYQRAASTWRAFYESLVELFRPGQQSHLPKESFKVGPTKLIYKISLRPVMWFLITDNIVDDTRATYCYIIVLCLMPINFPQVQAMKTILSQSDERYNSA